MKKISIVIPCYNEEKNVVPISEAIEQELNLKLSKYDYEIIFIDNCSTDQSRIRIKELAEKKAKLGTSCMKDFNFHTAHLKYTVSQALILNLGEKGEEAVKLALADYVDTFGQEYLDVLNGLYPVE